MRGIWSIVVFFCRMYRFIICLEKQQRKERKRERKMLLSRKSMSLFYIILTLCGAFFAQDLEVGAKIWQMIWEGQPHQENDSKAGQRSAKLENIHINKVLRLSGTVSLCSCLVMVCLLHRQWLNLGYGDYENSIKCSAQFCTSSASIITEKCKPYVCITCNKSFLHPLCHEQRGKKWFHYLFIF